MQSQAPSGGACGEKSMETHTSVIRLCKDPYDIILCERGISSFMTSTTSQPSNISGSKCRLYMQYIEGSTRRQLRLVFNPWCFRVGISRLEGLWESTTRIIQAGGDLCLKHGFGFGCLLLQHVERQIDLFDTLGFCWRCIVYISDDELELEI